MKLYSILLISFSLLFAQNSFAAIRYVTESGAGSMDGSSWTNAYPGTSLQIAIDASIAGDEVWVACGTYKPTTGTNRTIAFSMKNSVNIYGSFLGTETSLTERTFTCGPCSILSGEIGIAGNTDNSYKVIRNQGLNLTALLDGFVIRDGHDDRPATLTEGLGGGICNVGSGAGGICSPTIRNCVITNNRAEFGAGIFNDGYGGGNASPSILHCIIINNTATGGGGGIDNFGLSGNASPEIINCVITHNTATDAAGGMYCWGGSGGSASPLILHSVIANNTVTSGFGGGIIADRSNNGAGGGGGSGNVTIVVINCIIRGNSANTGPQFYTYESAVFMGTYSNIDTVGQFAPHISQGTNTGNINADPLFINSASPIGLDNCWMTNDDGYQLQAFSPCINTGDSTGVTGLDLAFNDRIVGSNIDMGAYEYDAGSMSFQMEQEDPLHIFPNPVSDIVNITSSPNDEVIILNSMGQIVEKINILLVSTTISLIHLDPGFYYLHFRNSDHIQKMIKY